MKRVNLLYWTFTGLFALLMLFSGIQNTLVTPESVAILSHLGYPSYIIPFLGVAKILGAITIIVPGFPRLKEWAYAGLFFDLAGATYSGIMTDGFQPPMAFYYHKRQRALLANPVSPRASSVVA
jgi:hypothetical protein